MKYIQVVLLMAGLLIGARDFALAAEVQFYVTDVPGRWFDTTPAAATGNSLAIIAPGDKVKFHQDVEARHTVTGLIWPSAAGANPPVSQSAVAKNPPPIDQNEANTDDHEVILTNPGLYVFVCKLHPYMLAGVIVDKDANDGALDIGDQLTLLGPATATEPVGTLTFDSYSDLGLRLLRAFFIVTNPSNWKDYTKVGSTYQPAYPDVPVRVYGVPAPGASRQQIVAHSLNAAMLSKNFDGGIIEKQKKPSVKGVGEVWVDTQFELTARKAPKFPGTMSVVEVDSLFPALNWEVKRKIALPKQQMNNGHNMWTSHDTRQIYQTEWHGKSLFVLDRITGQLMQELEVGNDPAHVMTRVDTQQVHVTLNGEDGVMELNRDPKTGWLTPNTATHPPLGVISMRKNPSAGNPTQPHAHWMGFDGQTMATPNANTNDSTLYNFWQNQGLGRVVAQEPAGALPIAASMMPDSSKHYVSNYLGHSISVMDAHGLKTHDISLLPGYDFILGCQVINNVNTCLDGRIGGLPVQTPVSPDGKFMITGNTLGGTISIVSTATNTVVKMLPCDPGCHGVNFGAKRPSVKNPKGGYYAYVTSKFANRLIVVDYDPDGNGDASDAEIAGGVVLANDNAPHDAAPNGNKGMGGQGVLPVPNVYNGWVQELPIIWKIQLTHAQRHPFPSAENHDKHDDDDRD